MPDFPNTRLSLIERIRLGDEDARQEALGAFIEDYRPALIDFLVKCKGVTQADADDLVNDFILNKIMQGTVLDLANDQNRFRSALRTCLQRYLIDSLRKRNREPIDANVPSDEQGAMVQADVDPLDRVWAIAVFGNTLAQMKAQCQHWELFVDRVLTQPPLGYDEIIKRYGYENPQKASNHLMTAKRTFNRILSACVEAQSSLSPNGSNEEVNDEVELLRIMLRDPNIVREALDRTGTRPIDNRSSLWAGSIGGQSISFLDETAESAWDADDIGRVFEHLLDQRLDQFGSNHPTATLRILLTSDAAEEDLVTVKEFFNKRGKTRNSNLPRRIDVTMAFALMAKFVSTGRAIDEITSMSREDLANRIAQFGSKAWVPETVGSVFDDALSKLKTVT